MSGIEFLEPAAADDSTPPPTQPPPTIPPDRRSRVGTWLPWAAAVCWAAAGVLALFAAYRPVLAVSYGGAGNTVVFGYSVDAWGHYSGGGAAEAALHGTRYAPLLCAAALASLALAGGTAFAAARARRPGSERIAAAVAALALLFAGFLAGTALTMAMQVTSSLGNVRASVHRLAGLGDPVNGDVRTAVGSAVVLALAAGVCALAAAVLDQPLLRTITRGRR